MPCTAHMSWHDDRMRKHDRYAVGNQQDFPDKRHRMGTQSQHCKFICQWAGEPLTQDSNFESTASCTNPGRERPPILQPDAQGIVRREGHVLSPGLAWRLIWGCDSHDWAGMIPEWPSELPPTQPDREPKSCMLNCRAPTRIETKPTEFGDVQCQPCPTTLDPGDTVQETIWI